MGRCYRQANKALVMSRLASLFVLKPTGEAHATVEGPRGTIGIHIASSGGEKPVNVQWQRPSAMLLPLLPEILGGQLLADAEVIVASLGLAMAEADG